MGLIDDIKRDREAGTPGPWRIKDADSIGDRCINYFQEIWNDETDILVTTEVTRAYNDGGRANIRRCARVPDLEAALLAAEELAEFANEICAARVSPTTGGRLILERDIEGLCRTLAAYLRATEGE